MTLCISLLVAGIKALFFKVHKEQEQLPKSKSTHHFGPESYANRNELCIYWMIFRCYFVSYHELSKQRYAHSVLGILDGYLW